MERSSPAALVRWRGVTSVLAVVLLLAAWVLALAFTVWTQRADALRSSMDTAVLHTRHFEASLTQSFQSIEQVALSLDVTDGQALRAHSTTETLRSLVRPVPYLRSLSVIDARGLVVASTNPENLFLSVDLANFFPDTDPSAEVLRVGWPRSGRDFSHALASAKPAVLSPDGRYFIPVLRKLSSEQGAHWLLAALNPEYFLNESAWMIAPGDGAMQWLRHDGVLLGSSLPSDAPGTLGAQGEVNWQPPNPEFGGLTQVLGGGRSVLTAYRVSERFPVVVAVHMDREAVLARWRLQAERTAWVALPVLLALLGLALWLGWRRHRLAIKQAELDEQQRLAATVFDSSSDAILVTSADACVLSVNRAFERVTGYALAEVAGQNPRFMSSGLNTAEFYRSLWTTLAETGQWHGEILNRHKQGHLYVAELSIHAVLSNGGVLQHYTGVLTDITELRAAQERLHLVASVFTHASEGIMITDPAGDIIEVNGAFCQITGFDRDEAVGRNASMLSSGRQGQAFYSALWQALNTVGRWTGEIWNRRKSGEVYAEMLTINAVRNPEGDVLRYVALFSDISLQKEHESQLERIAHFDALTGLPNRVLLADRLRQAMAQAVRRAQLLALVFLDLDGFKAINDTHGHDAGDHLLIAVAQRMKDALREGDSLARMGGDEFVAVLADLGDHTMAVSVLERLRSAAAMPVAFQGQSLQVSASLGVVFYPQAADMDAEQLMRQADQAMYQAKLAGKNRFHVFDPEQDRHIRGHHQQLDAVRLAMERAEFVLHYQPKVNMRTGELVGVEALIRWQHPVRGLLLPGEFLPAVQKDNLSISLGNWVLETALAQASAWRSQGLFVPVSVNVDARQLQHPGFFHRLRTLLALHGNLSPGDLELEVLETAALHDLDAVSLIMNRCRELGVGFALDDFGTGYSSLTYLRRLPASVLKIDQSFVSGMLDDVEDMAILEGVLGLARAFRTLALAEGVENTEQGEMLLRLGCEWAQGHAIARAMPAADLPVWVAHWHTDPVWARVGVTHKDDLPMLTAMVEHRAWVAQLQGHALGQRDAPPPLHFEECPLGRWLVHAQCIERHGHKAEFAELTHLHQHIHHQGVAVLSLRQAGRPSDIEAGLQQVAVLRDRLLAVIRLLLDGPA